MADLLGRLFFRAVDHFRVRYRNPTRDWPASSLTQLSYDLHHRALNGVPVGACLEDLWRLGPADWFSRRGRGLDLYYYRLGLVVGLWEDHVTSFEVLLDPQQCLDRGFHPFAAGRVTLRTVAESRRELTRTAMEPEVLALLGIPFDTGPLVGQRVHTFIVAGNSIDTYHDSDSGRLVRIEFAGAR